jgi:hypothetical protein
MMALVTATTSALVTAAAWLRYARQSGRDVRRRGSDVRAYHGKRALPKAYVARRHLAMPATTDYWVNDGTFTSESSLDPRIGHLRCRYLGTGPHAERGGGIFPRPLERT